MDKDKLIECVPNFSEGRDTGIIEAIYHSIAADGLCEVWDHSSDKDHNRSVFTLAGSPEALEQTIFRFVKTAAGLIDMRDHEGVHPCIGATDVVPLIPLKNTTMAECITLSETVGKKIADELNLPVYLYANSAKKSAHVRLADIRRGGYPRLCEEISKDPDRAPDFGPLYLPPAGGTSIGARDFLIAFNVFLDTNDPKPAKEIARKIRQSSGGFRGLQAIGLLVNGHAQISMNLLNYRVTSMRTVIREIQKEAEKLNIAPLFTELIGMLPAEALSGTDPQELLIRDFSEDRIIESRM